MAGRDDAGTAVPAESPAAQEVPGRAGPPRGGGGGGGGRGGGGGAAPAAPAP
ncbi:hypothetical protein I6A84_09550, partial [Frankia sp. CNm7]|nr:hypothetical protein [Frankia nepalensis]